MSAAGALPTRERLSAGALFDLVADPGSFVSWDRAPHVVPTSPEYAADLAAARDRSGVDEAVLTGECRIRGRRVAVVACEFSFLAGSIGVAAADRLVRAIERATDEGLPLLAGPASGGTRMQEGTVAFLSMVTIAAAVQRHKARRLPYLVYLRHPTTGGVMASWGSLGHVTVAEPGALLGFLGPRVYEAIHGEPFPADVQNSENLLAHGLIDAILRPDELADTVDRVLSLIGTAPAGTIIAEPEGPSAPIIDAWQSIQVSRRRRRPGVRDLLRLAAGDVLPLSGTGEGENDPALLLALTRFGDQSCIIVGQDRASQRSTGSLGPGALREARRGMRLASELGLPLVTVIDTPGAAMSRTAEEGGLAGEIARCLAELVTLPTPIVSVILGEGTGGGALALLPADLTLVAEHGWLAPLPPEGASAIIHHDLDHAAQMAHDQGITSSRLRAVGIVDYVVAERPDAAEEAAAFSRRMGAAIEYALGRVRAEPDGDRVARRSARYRSLGL